MNENQSIKDTLNIIRKALEDDEPSNTQEIKDNILILNQLVKDDGTINILNETFLTKKDTIDAFHEKLDKVFDIHLSAWFDRNIPNYIEKYFKKKDL